MRIGLATNSAVGEPVASLRCRHPPAYRRWQYRSHSVVYFDLSLPVLF